MKRQYSQQGGNWPPDPEEVGPKPVLPRLPRRGSGRELPPFTLIRTQLFLRRFYPDAPVHLTEDETQWFQQ